MTSIERRLIAEDAVEVDVVVRTDRSSGDVVISRTGRSSFATEEPELFDESPSAKHSPSATHSATGRAASAIGEPELLDKDARGPKDDGDPEGSWADLAERETVGVYDDDGRFDVRVCRENLEE